jgi:hypothetical protein
LRLRGGGIGFDPLAVAAAVASTCASTSAVLSASCVGIWGAGDQFQFPKKSNEMSYR